MSRRYKTGADRHQGMLLPERVEDYVAPENPVRALDAYVESLDLQALGFTHTDAGVSPGQPSYPPAALLKLYLYGYLMRVRSSRKLEQECHRNLEVLWLLEGLKPNNKTIANFRKDNAEPLQAANRDFVLLCRELELYGRELVAIDGSFFRGDVGTKGIHSRAQLKKRLQRIEADIAEHLAALDAADTAETATETHEGEPLCDKLAALRERQAREAERLSALEQSGETQVSEVDPDARRLQKNGQRVCGYNVQMAVDSRYKLLLDCTVTNEGNDSGQLEPVAQRARIRLGVDDLEVVADAGYFNPVQLKACADDGITPWVPEPAPRGRSAGAERVPRRAFTFDAEHDGYRCPQGQWLGRHREIERTGKRMLGYASNPAVCADCPIRSACLPARTGYRELYRWEHEGWLEDHYRPRMATEGAQHLRQRAALAEHPFGTLKRTCGWDHFLVRSLPKVRGEMALLMLAYNLRRVLNLLGLDGFRAALARRRHCAPQWSLQIALVALTGAIQHCMGFQLPRPAVANA